MTPRYVRVCKDTDVRLSPIAMNVSMIPDGPYGLAFYRVPRMETLDIERHLRHGISSPHGGVARIDLRYCGPHPNSKIKEINCMNWRWEDPFTGKSVDCTSPFNDTIPNDRIDDDIFIFYVELMQKDCFIMWYDKTNEVIFVDIGGLEPRYLLGAIRTSDNTMILKNEAVIENIKEK